MNGKDVKEELDTLVRMVPDFTFRLDRANPDIIHIIDGHLVNRSGYALDVVLDKFDFSGSPKDLLKALGSRGIRISQPLSVSFPGPGVYDSVTKIAIRATNITVREALTDFLPASARKPFLWRATLGDFDDNPMTEVSYYTAPSPR